MVKTPNLSGFAEKICLRQRTPVHFGASFGKNVANSAGVIAMPQVRSYNKI